MRICSHFDLVKCGSGVQIWLLLTLLKNCDLGVQADRLGILGGPLEVLTGFRFRFPGEPFGNSRRSVGGLQTQRFQSLKSLGGPLYYFRFVYLGGPLGNSRRTA